MVRTIEPCDLPCGSEAWLVWFWDCPVILCLRAVKQPFGYTASGVNIGGLIVCGDTLRSTLMTGKRQAQAMLACAKHAWGRIIWKTPENPSDDEIRARLDTMWVHH